MIELNKMDKLVLANATGRCVSATEQSLLFAVGGDYSAVASATDTKLAERRSTMNLSNSSDLSGGQIEKLGQLGMRRRNTIHRMGMIKEKLEKTPLNVHIDMEETMEDSASSQLREESKELETSLKKDNTSLDDLITKISAISAIKLEQGRIGKTVSITNFIDNLFKSVREGDLDSVKVRVAVLHLETRGQFSLKDLVEESSQLPLLHVALMCDQQHVLEFLIKHGGTELTTQSILSFNTTNLTPFYIALLHGNFEAVCLITESLHSRDDQSAMINNIACYEDHNGELQEELPLFCAITSCMDDVSNVKKVLEYLIEHGADLAKETTDGNTFLHFIVMRSSKKRYTHQVPFLEQLLVEVIGDIAGLWWQKKLAAEQKPAISQQENEAQAIKYLLGVVNKDSRTPFTLAAQEESPLYSLFMQWPNVMRFPDPRLGDHFMRANTYDVTAVSSIDSTGASKLTSVLNIVAHNKQRFNTSAYNREDILLTEPLRSIIREKWKIYRWAFYFFGLCHLLHMTMFSYVIFQHNRLTDYRDYDKRKEALINQPLIQNGTTGKGNDIIYFDNILPSFLLLPAIYLLSELQHLIHIRSQNRFRYVPHGNGFYRLRNVTFSVMTWLWLLLHELNEHVNELVVAFILIEGWYFLVFFLRGIILPFKNIQIAIFPSMVSRMFLYDVIPFMFLSLLIIIGFSTAQHAILLQSDYDFDDGNKDFSKTVYLMMKYLCGMPNPMDSKYMDTLILPKLLLLFYSLITTILLVNMLIAAMNRTYELIRNSKFSPLYRQRLSILLLFEHRLPKFITRLTLANISIMKNPRTGETEMFLNIKDKH